MYSVAALIISIMYFSAILVVMYASVHDIDLFIVSFIGLINDYFT